MLPAAGCRKSNRGSVLNRCRLSPAFGCLLILTPVWYGFATGTAVTRKPVLSIVVRM